MEAGEFRAELVFLGFGFSGVRGGGLFQPLAAPRRQPAAGVPGRTRPW
jgi:hypothetical protein